MGYNRATVEVFGGFAQSGATWRGEGPESPITRRPVTRTYWRAKPDGTRTVLPNGKRTGENGHKPKAKCGQISNGERLKQ